MRDLGHDVYYLEDVGDWSNTYDWEAGQHTDSLDYPGDYIRQSLEPYGFRDRWIYRAGSQSCGLSIEEMRQLCAEADLLLIRAVPFIVWRPEYDLPRRRAFIDVDPGFTQIRLAKGEPAFMETLGKCEQLFTISPRIGKPDCEIPTAGRKWHSTLPPVAVEQWPVKPLPEHAAFTSVIRWRGFKDMEYEGQSYGQRDREFPKFLDLPQRTSAELEIALTGGSRDKLVNAGWTVVDGWRSSCTTQAYQAFIQNSLAEFGVAKQCYVATRGGWFSDRSVCYLASGKPVIVQDTGLSGWLPTGRGVIAFRSLDEAVRAVEQVQSEYDAHSNAARRIAEEYFCTEKVLDELLENMSL
jgi:hypothetical protein